MTSWRRLNNAMYWLALTVWLSVLITAAISASMMFSTLGDIPIHLPEYETLPVAEHGRTAAGLVMAKIFFLVDMFQFAAIPLVIITLVLQHLLFKTPLLNVAGLARVLLVLIAAGLFAWHAMKLAPTMNHELNAHWKAAKEGDLELAEQHREAFNQLHPTAENIMRANLLLLIAAIVISPTVLERPEPRRAHLETPDLARGAS